MKRAAPILLVLVLVLVLGIWLLRQGSPTPDANRATAAPTDSIPTEVKATEAPARATTLAGKSAPLLGETILRDYANTNHPPENDLTLMSRLMENSLLLLKSAANRPLSANEDWADLFRGKNGARERFLPDTHAALNSQGQLVDRWGTPLFFHALGGGRFEIRSAGADKKLWSADDIHRNADGSFRRGGELNPASLFDATNNRAVRRSNP